MIKKRKAFKFQRDKLDYQNGQVFTFSRRYDSVKASKKGHSLTMQASTSTAAQMSTSTSDLSSALESGSDNEQAQSGTRLGFSKLSLAQEVD